MIRIVIAAFLAFTATAYGYACDPDRIPAREDFNPKKLTTSEGKWYEVARSNDKQVCNSAIYNQTSPNRITATVTNGKMEHKVDFINKGQGKFEIDVGMGTPFPARVVDFRMSDGVLNYVVTYDCSPGGQPFVSVMSRRKYLDLAAKKHINSVLAKTKFDVYDMAKIEEGAKCKF